MGWGELKKRTALWLMWLLCSRGEEPGWEAGLEVYDTPEKGKDCLARRRSGWALSSWAEFACAWAIGQLWNMKSSYRFGNSGSQLSECAVTYFLVCSISVQPRQVLNYLNYFVMLESQTLRIKWFVPNKFCWKVLRYYTTDPVLQHSPFKSVSTSRYLIYVHFGFTYLAIHWNANVTWEGYTYVCVHIMYTCMGWLQSHAPPPGRELFCLKVFLWHIWHLTATSFSNSYAQC